MSNVLSEEKKQQVIALGRLGWPQRRIDGRAYSHHIPLVKLKCISPKRQEEMAARRKGDASRAARRG